jgi:thiamine biosynthesis lipoprotein
MGSYASLAVAGMGELRTPRGGRAGTLTEAWPRDLDSAVAEVRTWLDTVEAALSPHRADSDLFRWRTGALPLPGCSPLLAEVIDAVGSLEDLTDGGFHPYDRQGRFDPTGYVKGWAVERAVGILTAAGVTDASFGVGGDVQMIGRAGIDRPWRVAVTDPADHLRILAVVQAPADGRAFAVATSGSAQRGDHIWAALGGRSGGSAPRDTLASVTVVGPGLGRVDACATAIWALAKDRPLAEAWQWLPAAGHSALAVTRTGGITTTQGMGEHLARVAA